MSPIFTYVAVLGLLVFTIRIIQIFVQSAEIIKSQPPKLFFYFLCSFLLSSVMLDSLWFCLLWILMIDCCEFFCPCIDLLGVADFFFICFIVCPFLLLTAARSCFSVLQSFLCWSCTLELGAFLTEVNNEYSFSIFASFPFFNGLFICRRIIGKMKWSKRTSKTCG